MKLSASLKSWKTTLTGIVPLITALLVGVGVIDLEQSTAIIDGVEVVFNSADSILNEVIGAIAFFGGLIGLFSKDGDKSSEEVGIK